MKKILHLFSDRSHSALWSRYLRMLTLIALLAFGSHGVWGLGIKRNVSMTNVKVFDNGTFVSNGASYDYTWSSSSNNLIQFKDLDDSDLSEYEKIVVPVSDWSSGVLRCVIRVKNDVNSTTDYTWSLYTTNSSSTPALKELKLVGGSFKNGETAITKDQLKNVVSVFFGGADAKGSAKIGKIYLTKQLDWDENGKITILPQDINCGDNVTKTGSSFTFNKENTSVTIDFIGNGISAKKLASASSSPTNPGFNIYYSKDENYENDESSTSELGESNVIKVKYACNTDPKTITINKFVLASNVVKKTIIVDGNTREYYVYVPSKANVNTEGSIPVIFSLHGRYNYADPRKDGKPNFNDIADADANGIIVVYPQGRSGADKNKYTGYKDNWYDGFADCTGWEATGKENGDTRFIEELVKQIKSDYPQANPKKFYLCGFSMGGMMTYAIANACPNIFAAYASTGGYPINEFHLDLANINRSPFLHIHPKDDVFVVYDKLETIKRNMVARYGHNWTNSYRDDVNKYDIQDFNSNTNVGALKYIEIDADQNFGHSIAPYAPNIMYDFFKDKAYVDYSEQTKEWSWDMNKFTSGGWDIGNNVISFGDHAKTSDNKNVYPCIQLSAGKHIIYAKISMAPSEENAYLTLKNNISGVEIVARKLKNNSGSSENNTYKVIAYEFETGENGEFSVYVGREKTTTSCTSLSIYKSPTTAVTESDESIDNSKIDITGYLLKIDFEELKRNSSDTNGTKTAELLSSGNYGMSCAQPSSGYAYYYANRLERKNAKHHYDVVTYDKIFGNYFQNMPHADIYERTSGEDFMRIMIPEGTLNTVAEKGTITIGFWVNANLAVDRGLSYCQQSMFYLAGDKFNGWNTDHPDDVKSEKYNAYMFNITCNGGISGYMRYDDDGTTNVAAYAGGTAFGGFCDTESLAAFYKKNHYMDGNWHYITFQMYDNLSRYNMYVDGLPATLGGYSPSDKPEVLKKGISGLKSIVLGGLNARNSEWSYDVAFAYDDIVIYDRVLSQAEIKRIISDKNYTPSWNFKRNLSNANLFDADKLKNSSIWTQGVDGVYSLNIPLSAKASLTYDRNEEIPAFRGLSFTTTAANQIKIDTSKGTLNVSSGAAVCFKNIPMDNYLRFTTQSTFENDRSEIQFPGLHTNYLECPVTLFKVDETSTGSGYGNPTITMKEDVVIYSILRTDKQFAQMWCEDKDDKITKTYSYNSSTPATNNPAETSMTQLTDLPEIILFVNGTKRNLADWKFKYSSSAPQVANVDQENGYVTITGIPGSAVITVELVNDDDKNETVHGNDALYERTNRIFASYEIINKREDNTFVVSKGTNYSNNHSFTLKETTDGVTKTTVSVTLGGWKYGTEYQGQQDAYNAAEELSGVDCFGFKDITTENERFTEIFGDGKSISTNGTYAAKSESWVKNDNVSGLYKPNEANTITNNTTPWTIPCRGTHIKVEPEYPGIMSVYVLQKGCVTERDKDNKPISVNLNQVYITDETGKSIREVICDTKTRVADQIWKNDGRARAEYTYNDKKYAITPEIFNSFSNNIAENQRWAFLDNWENPGMTGHVFCTDFYDGSRGVGIEGHVLISTGIVKYTFNVVPGKTYYIFSNNSPLGLAGFSFDKNKHINIVEVQGRKYSYLVANNNNPTALKEMASDITISNDNVSQLASSVCSSEIPLPYYDEITQSLTGDSKIKKYVPGTMAKITYNRAFTEGVWSSICLPYSISNRQMEEQFGEGTQVVLLNKIYDKDGHGIVQFIWHANQDIIAGYPYLILPMKTKSQIVTNSTIELKDNPLFSVTEGQKTIAYDNSNSESGYVFKGNFEEETIPVGSYVLNTSGKLARVGAAGLKLKPFRAYLRNNAGLNAKLLTTMAFSGWDDLDDLDNTTSIDEILEENGIFTKGANVYDLNGVLVRKNTHTIQGLPKGIYIVNGKKYVVK